MAGAGKHQPWCRWWLLWLILLVGGRIGEASHPGPSTEPPLISTWMGDTGFSEDQLVAWQDAEHTLNVSVPKQHQSSSQTGSSVFCLNPAIDGHFVAARRFRGRQAGFVFKTGPEGTGYYLDKQGQSLSNEPTIISLNTLIPAQEGNSALMMSEALQLPSACRAGRARRARALDGRRKHNLSRRKKAIAHFSTTDGKEPCSLTGLVGDKSWSASGLWAVDTANANCWASAEAAMVRRSTADILLLQETKRFTDRGIASATCEARSDGWNPLFSKAHNSGSGLGSGGGAVLTRRGTGIAPVEDVGIPSAYMHRLSMAWIDAVVRGGITCMSIYLRTAEGLSDANMCILEEAAAALNAIRGPWLVGGDWNLEPDSLASSNWLRMVDGVIFSTELPTCNDSTYDFFVVHRSIAHAVVGVQRLQDGGMNPHWASRLLLRGDARRFVVRKLVKPPKVDGVLPAGPAHEPPDYNAVTDLAGSAESINAAMVAWYSAARQEFSNIAGSKLDFVEARFKWACAAGVVAKPWHGASRISVMWRSLARRTEEIAKILHRESGSPLSAALLSQHLKAVWSAHSSLCNSARLAIHEQVVNFAHSLYIAVMYPSVGWVSSLQKLAEAKAKKLEAETAKRRASEWKCAVATCQTHPACISLGQGYCCLAPCSTRSHSPQRRCPAGL